MVGSNSNDEETGRLTSSIINLKTSLTTKFQKAGSQIGLTSPPAVEEEQDVDVDVLDELSELCPKLTFQQRIIGFVVCFIFGYLITFASFGRFMELVEGNPYPFILFYTVGNICALLASTFLCGPKRQFKSMFHETRKWTAIVYLSTILATIILCFIPILINSSVRLLMLLLLLLTQFFSYLWYSLSYIPFGRKTVKVWIKKICAVDDE